jgi:hypothetical protein
MNIALSGSYIAVNWRYANLLFLTKLPLNGV